MESNTKITTKDNLTEAFWQLYEKKEISKITVKEIAFLAGYNRSTFYEYFKDVYDVLEQLEDSLVQDSMLPAGKNSECLDFESFLIAFSGIFEKEKRYFSILLGDNGDPKFQRKIKNKLEPKIKEKLDLMGIEDEGKIDLLLEYHISAILGIMVYMHTSDNPPEIRDLYEVLNSLNKRGMNETIKYFIEI